MVANQTETKIDHQQCTSTPYTAAQCSEPVTHRRGKHCTEYERAPAPRATPRATGRPDRGTLARPSPIGRRAYAQRHRSWSTRGPASPREERDESSYDERGPLAGSGDNDGAAPARARVSLSRSAVGAGGAER